MTFITFWSSDFCFCFYFYFHFWVLMEPMQIIWRHFSLKNWWYFCASSYQITFLWLSHYYMTITSSFRFSTVSQCPVFKLRQFKAISLRIGSKGTWKWGGVVGGKIEGRGKIGGLEAFWFMAVWFRDNFFLFFTKKKIIWKLVFILKNLSVWMNIRVAEGI